MSDLNHQNIQNGQSNLQPDPVTIAAAATVAPTTLVSFISGTDAIDTITPPVTGTHFLIFIFTNANPGGVSADGNVDAALDPAQNQPMILIYNPITATYKAGVLALS